ncbi:MAG: L-glutamate gamma-semialdehyde dehydrogenase, partial [Desulfatiglandales bacterium]
MGNENFKIQLFRFVDVFPYLATGESLIRHIEEYFADQDLPSVFKWGLKGAGLGGKLTAGVLAKTLRFNIENMAKQFIIGENTKDAIKTLTRLRKNSFAFTVDILGEATVSEEEADEYQRGYLDLLEALEREQKKWKSLGDQDATQDWGHAPKINISVKPSAMYSQITTADFEGSVQAISNRIHPVLAKAKQIGAFMCIDLEQFRFKDITLEVYRRLRSASEFRDYPYLGVVLQAYLRQSDDDLERLLGWAKQEELQISIRLVKGAYWDYETFIAKQNSSEIPVYTVKAESDAAFERQAKKILENHDICHLACASHNIRSIFAVLQMARALDVPDARFEFQVLSGMAEPIRKGLQKLTKRVRLYCPYGELIPGMAYLVRRLLENTANESFLRQSFAEKVEIERLLEDPAEKLKSEQEKEKTPMFESGPAPGGKGRGPFKNEPLAAFARPEVRASFQKAISEARQVLGQTYPLLIGAKEIATQKTLDSLNPADPSEIIGHICQAGRKEIDLAVAAAKGAFSEWRDTSAEDRSQYLFRSAEIARSRIFQLAALQVIEVGKQWDQAFADVGEAIDFLEYYGREMMRLGGIKRMGKAPGELNNYFYMPKGLAAVIAPWNFPLAISCGMCSAAMVAGNCVIYKPSNLSAVTGYMLADIFKEAGIPEGVFNYTPGPGSEIGDYLVDHPDISVIAFTGSMEVGLRIIERAGRIRHGQANVKKVIAEMGGKNAIIVDDDADLDQAVTHVIQSAFGYQGQKCSACSRAIVLESIYDKFVRRLVEAAKSIRIGPAEDPANFMGPVVDGEARKKILEYIEIGKKEGTLLLAREVPQKGYYVPLTIFAAIKPHHRLAKEEIFGPVLSIMKATTFDEAIEMANSTRFALTGGVFSRSPRHLEQARKTFEVGNLYLNRGITGALVERQPFGGFRMSGVGSKAGGPDYLLQFMDPRLVCENTMRRGFAPVSQEDDWI